MKIWVSKNSEVPVREQLITQISLAIAAGDYDAGERLPSTREIARRCGIHANTVASAYQRLVDQNLLEFRKGSGFYVAESAEAQLEGSRRLDDLIRHLFESAKDLGYGEKEVIARLKKSRAPRVLKRVAVVEPDPELRDILVHELSARFPGTMCVDVAEIANGRIASDVVLAAMFDEKPKIDALLGDGRRCIYLRGRSVSSAMSSESRPGPNELVGVVSGWESFLTFARVMLLAAQLDPGNLIVRSTSDENWRDAIRSASIVICDSLTATALGSAPGVRPFQLIADESLADLEAVLYRS